MRGLYLEQVGVTTLDSCDEETLDQKRKCIDGQVIQIKEKDKGCRTRDCSGSTRRTIYVFLDGGASGGDLILSDKGTEFIARHEGLGENPYNDSQGYCTVGVGHWLHKGLFDGTEAESSTVEALDLFKKDAVVRMQAVNRLVTVDLMQPLFDALVSFVNNVGEIAFA